MQPGFPSYQVETLSPGIRLCLVKGILCLVGLKTWIVALKEWVWTPLHLTFTYNPIQLCDLQPEVAGLLSQCKIIF